MKSPAIMEFAMQEKRSRRPILLVVLGLLAIAFIASLFVVPKAPTERVEEQLKAETFLNK